MKKIPLFLLGILFLALLLRLPSLFEPNWYGDEGIYQTIGKALLSGRVLYVQIWDNKPPLLYVIYAVFNGEQFWVRLASLLVMFPTIIFFYKLAQKLFADERIVYFVTFLFGILFAGPLLEGNIANAENFMYVLILPAIYLVFTNTSGKKIRYFFAGFLLGLAFLIKIVAVFDLAALSVFLFIIYVLRDNKKWFTQAILLGTGFGLPVVITVLYFIFQDALSDFLTATLSQNVSYFSLKVYFYSSLLF